MKIKNIKPNVRTLAATVPISIIYYMLYGLILYWGQAQFNIYNVSTYVGIAFFLMPIVLIVCALIIDGDVIEVFGTSCAISIVFTIIFILLIAIVSSFGGNLYHSNEYYDYVNERVEKIDLDTAFPELIEGNDTSKLPLFGIEEAKKKSAAELANTTALGSQTSIMPITFMSQNINDEFVYVGESRPNSVFRKDAANQYYIVNRNSGKTNSINAKNFKFARGRYFSENVERRIKEYYANKDNGFIVDVDLEIDDSGNPYYVGTILKKTRFNGLPSVKGVVLLNPITGEINEYDIGKIPMWVDRVYPEDLLISYIEIWGKYKKGYLNSIFKKEGVLVPSEYDFEVIYIDGEAYIWTGLQTKSSDNTSVNGIVIASLKTGKIYYYQNPGVSEYQAKTVAEGLVQEKDYKASSPVPLKCNGEKALFMLMRDNGRNIVGYSLVSYEDYTKSAYATDINELIAEFFGNVSSKPDIPLSNLESSEITGVISAIATEVVDGRTVYNFLINGEIFVCNSKVNPKIVFAQIGDEVTIKYTPSKEGTHIIEEFTFIKSNIKF